MQKVIAYTDGGSRGNPGISGLGVYVVDEAGQVLAEVAEYLGVGTNNRAEYLAVLRALETVHALFPEGVTLEVRLDSELVQRQLTGVYKVKHPDLKPLFLQIAALIKAHFPHARFTHVRREYNKEADRLANEAMDRGA